MASEKSSRGFRLSPLTAFTLLAAVGIVGMMGVYVATGFVLDERERALGEAFAAVPDGAPTPLSEVVPGDWTDACVLNEPIPDPGKTKTPSKMPGMLIPPMRNHATFLTSGYWLIVTLDGKGDILSESRVDPDAVANRTADNGGNFCAGREALTFALEPCEEGCARRIVFDRGAS
ncbi:hypothetical protein [Rhodobium gokarnense]|uniref:Uncharacterized protein n=1 Tax=Rhodobium gokarnense TaxID=364296 RepID=A0ABT3HA41_9HYPH|nr:hypothetical protein [Rhodobium gokarnense]MCW2307219.1 hypothetical protein [Rhodobium gokarnense]